MSVDNKHEDVFLLYNEREDGGPEFVVSALREQGLSLYFYRTDFPVGGEISRGETEKLESARAVVVLLGKHGWGPTQREIAHRAESLNKHVVPVLIGNPPEGALEDVGGMFERRRWLDIRTPTAETPIQLAEAVRRAIDTQPAPVQYSLRFDDVFKTLTDGSVDDRSMLLQRIRRDGVVNSAALAARLRRSILEDFSPGQENKFATAIRPPKSLTSTRSWMLSVLIWLRPFNDESAEVIAKHVDPDHETDRAVRFWTLAGTIEARPFKPT